MPLGCAGTWPVKVLSTSGGAGGVLPAGAGVGPPLGVGGVPLAAPGAVSAVAPRPAGGVSGGEAAPPAGAGRVRGVADAGLEVVGLLAAGSGVAGFAPGVAPVLRLSTRSRYAPLLLTRHRTIARIGLTPVPAWTVTESGMAAPAATEPCGV